MILIIVESPTKARTLNKFLGDDYMVEATLGHIKDLPKSPISVDIENNFEPDYKVVDRQKKTISTLKKAGKKADKIYLATDPDREGEAIAAHVQEILKDKKTERITFHEITKSAVEDAISKPGVTDINLVNAQIARRVLDRLVGYKLSPLLWKKVRRGLSAGRVQTVTLRLIIEKEREIEAFKPVEYWEISCDVKATEKFNVNLVKINDKKAVVNNAKQATEIKTDLEKSKYTVNNITKREVKKNPNAPFTTSTLTQAGANKFGWSAKKTMMVAQKLYEQGLITYHRTDSFNVAKSAIDMARNFVTEKYGKEYLPESVRMFKTKSKSAQEAHEAIRPTDLADVNIKEQDQTKLYNLIRNRFLASQMAVAIMDSTRINVKAEGDKNYILTTSGEVVKFLGWRKVIPSNKEDNILPVVNEKDVLQLIKVLSDQKFTQPPARFNEASIIKKLEELGIGRPSTYAPTISTIIFRNYVEKRERKFFPTTIGIAVNDFLVPNFAEIFDYGFTASMEESLDDVAEGKLKWQDEIAKFWGPFVKKLDDVTENSKRVKIETEKLNRKCPDCKDARLPSRQGELVIRVGRFGKFISCETFPECKYTEKFMDKIDMKCPDCEKGEVIIKKTKKGRPFFGCSTYPDCEYASWKDPRKLQEEK